MNGIQKIKLLDELGLELQARMSFTDIDTYFRGHGVPTRNDFPINSKKAYAKEMLAQVRDDLLITIAGELGIIVQESESVANNIEVSFWQPGYFRLFLSHLASFKIQTSQLQSALKKYAISSFVAHEDIEPTREWQNEIEAGLKTMDALAAILMPGFPESKWCDQEVGVAVGRDILIIPIRRGLDPYGFIGKYQGIQGQGKKIGEVAEAIFKTLVSSPKTRNKILLALSGSLINATTEEDAFDKISIFNSLPSVPVDTLENLKHQLINNKILMESDNFLAKLNSMLSKFNVSKMNAGRIGTEEKWDDIPF